MTECNHANKTMYATIRGFLNFGDVREFYTCNSCGRIFHKTPSSTSFSEYPSTDRNRAGKIRFIQDWARDEKRSVQKK